MSTDTPPNNVIDSTKLKDPSSNSVSKSRRRRRRNNKKKKKTKQIEDHRDSKTSSKATNLSQTRIHTNKTPKKSPWHSAKKSSTFATIMNEQQATNASAHDYIYEDVPSMTDQDLLEQQMILQSIIESTKQSKSTEISQHDDDRKKQTESTNAETVSDNAALNDEILAVYLQQQEQQKLLRKQRMSEMYDGKYGKVTSSSAHSTAIPKAALKFYYDDESMMCGNGLTKEQFTEETQSNKTANDNENITEEDIAISKHDAKIWSETHLNRLNEYEAGGNLNTNMMISNQAYNSFRNKLDKKGFISYHNYRLEPKDNER